MKYIRVLVILFWSSLIFQTKQSNAQDRTIICGRIFPQDTLDRVVRFSKWSTPVFDPKIEFFTTVTKNGYFKISIDLTTIGSFTFSVDDQIFIGNYAGESSIYLEPGDSLFLTINSLGERMSDIRFSGTGVEKQDLKRKIGEVYGDYLDGSRSSFDLEIKRTISRKKAILQTISQYKEKISEEAYKTILAESLASVLSNFSNTLLDNHARASQAELLRAYQTTRQIFDPEELLAVNVQLTKYLDLLQDYALLEFLVKNHLPISRAYSKNKLDFFDALQATLVHHPLRDAILSNYIVHFAKVSGWDDQCELMFTQLRKEVEEDNRFYTEVCKVRNSFKFALSSADETLNFTLYDTLDRPVSLRKYLGSVVLIDFMFTGCGGCVSMAPALARMEEDFRGQDVTFLSISIDASLSRFKRGFGKFSSPGSIPLYTGGSGNNHKIIQYFNVIAYPTLVLIDKRGDVVASRTSDPRTSEGREILSQAIKQSLNE